VKCVLVEDYSAKRSEILRELRERLPDLEIDEARSVSSAVRLILRLLPRIVLLDMSLPTYDVRLGEEGGRHQPFGGREVLEQLLRRGVQTRVVVVTQFVDFGFGGEYRTSEQLNRELSERFGRLYWGLISYSAGVSGWQEQLCDAVQTIRAEEGL